MAQLTALSEDDLCGVADVAGIGRYVSHEHVAHSNKNTAYLLRTERGRFFVKVYEDADASDLRAEAAVIAYLSARGIPVAAIRGAVQQVRGKAVLVQEYVEGEIVEKFSVAQLRHVAASAARLQAALADCDIPIHPLWNDATRYDAFFDASFLSEELSLVAEDLEPRLACLWTLPRQLVHADIHEYNVLLEGEAVRAILDFDICLRDVRANELAVIIASSCWTDDRWDQEKIRAAVESFTAIVGYADEELSALYPLALRRSLQSIVWVRKEMYGLHPEKQELFDRWIATDTSLVEGREELKRVLDSLR